MKTTLFTIAFSMVAAIVSAQSLASNEVPRAVLSSYVSQHSSGASDSVWAKKVQTIYTVFYREEDQLIEAQYAEDGTWIRTIVETSREELFSKSNIGNTICELYPGHRVVKTYTELDNEGKFYVVELQNGRNLLTVYFTTTGQIYK